MEDSYITSPGIFTDREGFLRDYGGITGARWTQDMKASLNPYYRLEVISAGRPNVLLSLIRQTGVRSSVGLGLAWPQRRHWLPYARFYPAYKRTEIGAVGRGWQIRMAGDDWLFASPRNAEVGLSAAPIKF